MTDALKKLKPARQTVVHARGSALRALLPLTLSMIGVEITGGQLEALVLAILGHGWTPEAIQAAVAVGLGLAGAVASIVYGVRDKTTIRSDERSKVLKEISRGETP